MTPTKPPRPKVFVDADVLFTGAASPSEHGASLLILRLAEITLIEALTSEQVISEAKRNLTAKLPQTLPAFHHLVSRCLEVAPDPNPECLLSHHGLANPNDLPIPVAAVREGCPGWFHLTFIITIQGIQMFVYYDLENSF